MYFENRITKNEFYLYTWHITTFKCLLVSYHLGMLHNSTPTLLPVIQSQ